MAFFVVDKQNQHKLLNDYRLKFQPFRTVEDLNKSIRCYMCKYKGKLSKTTIAVFRMMYKHSVVHPGISFLSNKSIAKQLKVSVRSVIRATDTLQREGIIMKVKTARKNGSDTTNTVYIKPFVSVIDGLFNRNVTPLEEKMSPLESGFSFKQEKSLNKRTDEPLDHTFVSDSVPQDFVQAAKPFFDDAKIIEEYWKMVRVSNYHANCDKETITELAIHAFKQMIGKLKRGNVKNTYGYFYGIMQKKLRRLCFEEMTGL